MDKIVYILLALLLTSGCATPFPPVDISRDMSHCKSPGCIIYEMWEADLAGQIKGTKLKALEGFIPPLPLSLSDANGNNPKENCMDLFNNKKICSA